MWGTEAMTDTSTVVVADEQEHHVVTPIPVAGEMHVLGRLTTSEEPADFGAYTTITLTGTEDKRQILPYDALRVRAWIIVSGTGPVWIGSEAQCSNVKAGNTAGGGAQLAAAAFPVPVGHKQPVWLVPDGTHSATVVVIVERMRQP